MSTTVARVNITVPEDLLRELKKTVPKRARSKVIADALRKEMARIKREENLKKLKGIWTKAGGVDFNSDKDLNSWRKNLWSSTNTRIEKKISG